MAVLVIGASGKTGRAVTRALARRGATVVAAIRPSSRSADACRAAGAAAVVGIDLHTGLGLAEAMGARAGEAARDRIGTVEAIYHLAPNVDADEVAIAERVVRAALAAGVTRVAFHSVLHPDDASMPHHRRKAEAEVVVRQACAGAVVLRPAAYLENLLPAALAGEIAVPYRLDAPFSNVALEDVAQVAAEALLGDSLVGRTLELSGPETVGTAESAQIAAEVLGHPVHARQVSIDEWVDGPGAALPPGARSDLLAMFAAYDREGLVGDPTDLRTVLASMGRQPRSWADVLRAAADPDRAGRSPAEREPADREPTD